MPDVERLSIDELLIEAKALVSLGIRAVVLFPVVPESKKSLNAEEAFNTEGLANTQTLYIRHRVNTLALIFAFYNKNR
jgi:porphobilinogen synthase